VEPISSFGYWLRRRRKALDLTQDELARQVGCDMGLFDDMHPPIARRAALVDGTVGVDIYPELAPAPGEHVIKKHRYSGFFGTDLDMILREWGSTPSSSPGRPPRIAARQPHGTRCFATTGWSFCRTRPQPMTTQTEDVVRCQPPTSTTRRW
jgi:isochorismatase family protein